MERMGAFAGIAFAESDMLIVPQSSQRSAFPLVVPLDHDHDGIAGLEIRVLVVERISAHDDRAVGEVTEHAASVFACDACPAAQPMG